MSIDELRRFAVARQTGEATLGAAIERLGFVQADPIRAPARAQDLTLRHRVAGYRAGDLDRAYAALAVEEDTFINYGFVTRTLHATMHPRHGAGLRPTARNTRARDILAFVRERGAVHPRDVEAEFAHGTVTNYWGSSSKATTHLLEAMHYKGLLRVAGRQDGIRIYAVLPEQPAPGDAGARRARVDALVDAVVRVYAPLPAPSLAIVVRRLRYAAPQWTEELPAALDRATRRLARARAEGATWYWPEDETGRAEDPATEVRLLSPFDPLVWDRNRFEQFWGWPYRFEAYTPASRRKLGYYALPLLWRDRAIGWANLKLQDGRLQSTVGFVTGRPPRDRAFAPALEAELSRMRAFVQLGTNNGVPASPKSRRDEGGPPRDR